MVDQFRSIRRHRSTFLCIIALFTRHWNFWCYAVQYDRDGRYSYSLTTFDPSGKLGQVDRAIEAAEQGVPIVAMICKNNNEYGIVLAAPQVLPNVFTIDDGTTRFSIVTPNIMISHSGLSSDGRILVAAAQKLAVQHEYTFDESIEIRILLEELSLLYQEYTMKVAARPFGASLILAYVPLSSDQNANRPVMFRIDPSGSVESLGQYAIVHGRNLATTDLMSNLKQLSNTTQALSIEEIRDKVVELLREALQHQQMNRNDDEIRNDATILTAILSRAGDNRVFCKDKHEPD
jgi:20S proteasome alpha/beta subunit